MYKDNSTRNIIIIVVSVLVIIIGAFLFVRHKENSIVAESSGVQLAPTYYDDIKAKAAQANADLKKTPSTQEIVKTALLKSVGLDDNDKTYAISRVDNSDGVFIKQGIINGNGIPYTSDFKSSNGGQPLSTFDANDQAYWQNIKNDDYNSLRAKAEATIQAQNDTQNRATDLSQVITRAKDDIKQKQNNLDSKDLKAQFVKQSDTAKNLTKSSSSSSSSK